MIIDQLPNLASVQETDEIPVERGTTTYKATLQKLKDLVASLLTKADIGLGNVANKDLSNVDNVRQYSSSNPPPYPVTSVNGETGEVTVYSRTLLWTNPNPSTLAAGTVNVDMAGYDYVEIECTETGNPPMRTFFVKCPIGTDSTGAETALTTFFFNRDLAGINALGVMSRYARVYLQGIVFNSGDMLYDGTYYKDWDNRAVPYRIWGIKY